MTVVAQPAIMEGFSDWCNNDCHRLLIMHLHMQHKLFRSATTCQGMIFKSEIMNAMQNGSRVLEMLHFL